MPRESILSPNGRIKLSVSWDDGKLSVSASRDHLSILDSSPAGLMTADGDASRGLRQLRAERSEISESYVIPAYKKSRCENRCRVLTATFATSFYQELTLEARAYDEGVAFRMSLTGAGDYAVLEEATALRVPANALCVYGMKHLVSYEDQYHPIPISELCQNRLAFPVLIEAAANVWALYTEAAVFGDYGGSSLLGDEGDPMLLRVLKSEDKSTPITGKYPLITPWRVVVAGGLDTIVETELIENLNPPSIVSDPSFIKPGVSAWSWMSENDSVYSPERARDYVDYAQKMGFPYFLVDWHWPESIPIPPLVEYAEARGVKLWIWEHSADIRDEKTAEEKLSLWASWGVVGVKIDFFESDSQERIAQYAMLAEKCAKHRLMLNFHGCTKPAGEKRTWPHLMTREGVQGGEYLQHFSTFTPMGPDAAHNCTLPFTRNAIGEMDYTPVVYRTYDTGTTDAHQTALTVVFTSYVLHIGEGLDAVLENPCAPFLKIVPTAWDETRLLEGYPASHVTMARRSNESWFVGSICARRPRVCSLAFDFLGEGEYEATLYADDLSDLTVFSTAVGTFPPADEALCREQLAQRDHTALHNHDLHKVRIETFTARRGDVIKIPLSANGGFAMAIRKLG